MATDFIPAEGVTVEELADAAQLSSLSDETPEGRSIVILAKEKFNIRGREVSPAECNIYSFYCTIKNEWCGFKNRKTVQFIRSEKVHQKQSVHLFKTTMDFFLRKFRILFLNWPDRGQHLLVVAEDNRVLGVIHLKDIVKGGIKQRFAELTENGYQNRNDYRR